MTKKVLLTGATGFVGSRLARNLIAGGFDVTILSSGRAGFARIEDILDSIKVIRCRSGELIPPPEADHGPFDACVHVAWTTDPGKYIHSPDNIKCLRETLDLYSWLARSGCRRVVGVGSCFEYDLDFGLLRETTPLKPNNHYTAAKISAFQLGTEIFRAAGAEFAWARIFYLYGPGEHQARLVPSVISGLLRKRPVDVTEGRQVRDFMHVDDAAEALKTILESPLQGPVNVGSGIPVTVREIVSRLASITGATDLVRFGSRPENPVDPPFICASNALLRRLGWTPRIPLDRGLEETVGWHRALLDSAGAASPD